MGGAEGELGRACCGVSGEAVYVHTYVSNTVGGRRWDGVSRVALSISCGAYTPTNPAH